MGKYFILMGDVIGSRHLNAAKLHEQLGNLLTACNKSYKSSIISPYTSTLGDEFQGIADSLQSAIKAIFYLEDERMKKQYEFGIRYVVHYGKIETQINTEIAYGMMGPGLTRARELLDDKRRGRPRFLFDLPNQKLELNLTRLCEVIEGLTNRWKRKDYPLIFDMLSTYNNAIIAGKYGKTRSQIWKRRKHLLVEEYKATKAVLFALIENTSWVKKK